MVLFSYENNQLCIYIHFACNLLKFSDFGFSTHTNTAAHQLRQQNSIYAHIYISLRCSFVIVGFFLFFILISIVCVCECFFRSPFPLIHSIPQFNRSLIPHNFILCALLIWPIVVHASKLSGHTLSLT